jgi:heat shock protein HtpX
MNTMKITLLLGLLTGLFLAVGGILGGQGGLVIAFVFAIVMNVGSYWFSDKIVLSMYRAQEVGQQQAPQLHRIVSELAQAAGIPRPKIAIVPVATPNAFATGRDPDHGVVAVTQGILQILNEEELKGVLAHEMGHIKNRDTLIQCLAATIAGAVMMLASMARWAMLFGGVGNRDDGDNNPLVFLAMAIFAPFAALLIQMAISRTREFEADKAGAQFSHNPDALANALVKLHNTVQKHPMRGASPSTSHLFIVNPFKGGVAGLFSTHPPMAERVKRLRSMRAV